MSRKRKYLRTTYDLGDEKIIFKSHSGGMFGNHRSRAGKSKTTSAKVEKHNRDMAELKLLILLKLNFIRGDYNLVLTYQEGLRPDPQNAKKIVQKFFRDLKAWCSKSGIACKYIWTTHIGKRGGIHHHVVLNQRIPYAVICNIWKYGSVQTKGTLYPNKDYRGLAHYLVNDDKNGDCPSAHAKGERRFNASRNLKRVEPKREWITAGRWRNNPVAPKGWIVDTDTVKNGIDLYGFPYQSYHIKAIPQKQRR